MTCFPFFILIKYTGQESKQRFLLPAMSGIFLIFFFLRFFSNQESLEVECRFGGLGPAGLAIPSEVWVRDLTSLSLASSLLQTLEDYHMD